MSESRMPEIWRQSWQHRSFVIGIILSFIMLLTGVISLFWTPYSVELLDIPHKLQGTSAKHWLGTDHFGRDVLSMLMVGAWNSMLVSVFAIGFGAGIGVPLGALAAGKGGWVEESVMRFNDFAFAFPALLTAVMLSAVYGPGTINSVLAIGIFNVPVFARITRGSALSIYKREFILAARTAGKGEIRIAVEHILPNIASVLIVQGTIQFALGILAEAGLSYLGLGTQPPLPSWGKMLSEAQTMMFFAPQLAILPGLAIVFTVLGLNLLGDGLRDILDPRLSRVR
ncbi:MAG TPA: ABC transporter permease [Deltaproteobacteria bacterium]|nr:peptide ABC transporter permease [Deltaproteobacteria bacterium]HIA56177.1 ABC transporter permease [Candidatus Lambdaproteobacteria bacterium]HIN47766.1 ABC transporter permease [Deltaproteobacteria bacterium]HIO10992.1 ABC transporter permease [Deltaproteobacteria bacterium]HIO62343.1 ABC transporter permease [Deltaproteobacteria bacterium]